MTAWTEDHVERDNLIREAFALLRQQEPEATYRTHWQQLGERFQLSGERIGQIVRRAA